MENKYYTPAIEDIRFGYECETMLPLVKTWNRCIFTGSPLDNYTLDVFLEKIKVGEIRTPYLTKEQIETEGWKIKTEYTGKFRFVFEKGNSWLAWNPEENMMTIMPIDPSKEFYEHNVRYAGGCPSINEFRQITKLLGI